MGCEGRSTGGLQNNSHHQGFSRVLTSHSVQAAFAFHLHEIAVVAAEI